MHASVDELDTRAEEVDQAHTWEAPAATAAIREKPLRMSSVRVENLRQMNWVNYRRVREERR